MYPCVHVYVFVTLMCLLCRFSVLGDILGARTVRSWEFNSDFPIRSIVLPYWTCGPPLLVLKVLRTIGIWGHEELLAPSGYWLLVLPRLTMTLLSCVADFLVYKTAKSLDLSADHVLCLFSSSYVAMVYFTRPFSNTIEAFLLAALVYLVAEPLPRLKAASRKVGPRVNPTPKLDKDAGSSQVSDSDREVDQTFHANSSSLSEQNPGSRLKADKGFWIALVVVMGVFNRPTFVAFAVIPGLYWLYTCARLSNGRSMYKVIFTELVKCGIAACFFSLVFTVCDSVYYGNLDISAIWQTPISGNSFFSQCHKFRITPYNFLLYNLRSENLAEHGIHPRVTHAIVNLPLLFGIVAVLLYWGVMKLALSSKRRRQLGPVEIMLLASVFVPLVILSVFPHQEPRFLIPLLIPVALICGSWIFDPKALMLVKLLWIGTNIGGALMFGALHQGGVVPSVMHAQKLYNKKLTELTQDRSQNHMHVNLNIIYFHTYMPPRYLLALPDSNVSMSHDLRHSSPESRTEDRLQMKIHDLQGGTWKKLDMCIDDMLKENHRNRQKTTDIYIVMPMFLAIELCESSSLYKIERIERIAPHVTFDKPPTLDLGRAESRSLEQRQKCDQIIVDVTTVFVGLWQMPSLAFVKLS